MNAPTVQDRLFGDYVQSPWITSTDSRWETLLADLRRGWIRLEKTPGGNRARIVVLVGGDTEQRLVDEDTIISTAEAIAALEFAPGARSRLTGLGPFCCCGRDGLMTVRQAFGAALCLTLPLSPVPESLAAEAAEGATIGGNRSLMLLWRKTLVSHWITAAPPVVAVPALLIPVDFMLTSFARQLQLNGNHQ